MASKGQKFNKYSPGLKEIILKEYFEQGIDSHSLGKKYDVPHQTIRGWVAKTKRNIDVKMDHRLGRSGKFTKKKNLTLEDYKERYEILKKYQAFLQARRGKK